MESAGGMQDGMQDAPTAAAVVDLDGVVSGWSDGGRSLVGWTTGQVVGRPVTDLVVDPPPGFPGRCGAGTCGSCGSTPPRAG